MNKKELISILKQIENGEISAEQAERILINKDYTTIHKRQTKLTLIKPAKKEDIKETPCLSLKELSMQLQTDKPLEEIKKEFEK